MVKELFFNTAWWYDPLFGGVLGGFRALAARIVSVRKGERVLDVGCGTGAQLAFFQDGGCDVNGIDRSLAMLRAAKLKLGAGAMLSNCDAIRLPYTDDSFDLVVSSLFLHQLNSSMQSSALGEMMRVLKPEGQILLIDFHQYANRSIMGIFTYLLIRTIEFSAGWEHFTNSRKFLLEGGVPKLALHHGAKLQKTIVTWNGNLGLYLLRSS